jgi:two-component system, OmpR family, sensor histidine kinase KdpD
VKGLLAGVVAVALVSVLCTRGLHVTNQTTVALSFLLVVLVVATISARWAAVATSLMAFACFNFFFLSPVGTFTIARAEDWIALFTLLAVSLVASHLSSQVRRRTREATAAQLKSALLASLSHDLKTPLTAVTVAANNLNASWLTEEQRREQAAIVQTELERLNRLFQDIVDMARIETRAVAVEREWVDPEEIVEAAARQAEPALRGHRIEIAGLGGMLVSLDPRLTSAALSHLLENAGQYSAQGAAVRLGVSAPDGEVRFAVQDAGPGISAGDLPHVFERFYRGESARRARSGTGMGLSIAQGLVSAQGGRIVAENRDGGAVFTIVLPAKTKRVQSIEGEVV